MASGTSDAVVETQLNGEAIIRCFAQAMDRFEDSLRIASSNDAEAGSRREGDGVPTRAGVKGQRGAGDKRGREAKRGGAGMNGMGSEYPLLSVGEVGPVYRSVVRGLGADAGNGVHQQVRGEGGRRYTTCLSLCSRKPLLAGISRPQLGPAISDGGCEAVQDVHNAVDDDCDEGSKLGGDERGEGGNSAQRRLAPSSGGTVLLQVKVVLIYVPNRGFLKFLGTQGWQFHDLRTIPVFSCRFFV